MGNAAVFDTHRNLMLAVAYRMLGSAVEAEDVVQEAFVRWMRVDIAEVESPAAYLTRVVTRLCIDLRQSARARREAYTGTWLPEPVAESDAVDGVDHVRLVESLSMAFLVMLERLSPVERAVVLLRDVFEYSYEETATMVGKSAANCRQILHRARAHLRTERPRFEPRPGHHDELARRFMHAAAEGDAAQIVACLHDDATLWTDGGGHDAPLGRARAIRKPIAGSERVAGFIGAVIGQAPHPVDAVVTRLNGQPGLLAYAEGRLRSAIVLDVAGDRIANVFVISNPAKLVGLETEN